MGIEIRILDQIQNIRTPLGDVVMPLITRLGDAGAVWILLAVVLLIVPKTRRSGAVLAAALCVDVVLCNGILKGLFGRIRPCDVNTSIQLLVARPDDFSFPSGHTAASFAAVAALMLAGERRLWKPVLLLAVFIAFSRMYLYVHYPTDIVGGVIVGVLSGAAGHLIVSRAEKKNARKGDELWTYGCQIVAVDDGSGEGYQQIFDRVGDICIVLRHGENRGKGAAIKAALSYIKRELWDDGPIGIMDCDGQHLPEDMMRSFRTAGTRRNTLVLGVRAVGKEMPLRSRLGNQITRAVYRIVSGVNVSDTQTGLRAFGPDLIDRSLAVKGERYEYEMNMLMACAEKRSRLRKCRSIPSTGTEKTPIRIFGDSGIL